MNMGLEKPFHGIEKFYNKFSEKKVDIVIFGDLSNIICRILADNW